MSASWCTARSKIVGGGSKTGNDLDRAYFRDQQIFQYIECGYHLRPVFARWEGVAGQAVGSPVGALLQ